MSKKRPRGTSSLNSDAYAKIIASASATAVSSAQTKQPVTIKTPRLVSDALPSSTYLYVAPVIPDGTSAATAMVWRRMTFLIAAAHTIALSDADVARQLIAAMRKLADDNDIAIDTAIQQTYCLQCNSVFVAGLNCRMEMARQTAAEAKAIRRYKKRKQQRRNKQAKTESNSPDVKASTTTTTAHVAGKKSQRTVACTRHCSVIICAFCGQSTLISRSEYKKHDHQARTTDLRNKRSKTEETMHEGVSDGAATTPIDAMTQSAIKSTRRALAKSVVPRVVERDTTTIIDENKHSGSLFFHFQKEPIAAATIPPPTNTPSLPKTSVTASLRPFTFSHPLANTSSASTTASTSKTAAAPGSLYALMQSLKK